MDLYCGPFLLVHRVMLVLHFVLLDTSRNYGGI